MEFFPGVNLQPTDWLEITRSVADDVGSWYAILDATDEPRVPVKVGELDKRAVSLYRGWAERDYWALAPYLVEVDADMLNWIHEQLGTAPWGILLRSAAGLNDLRSHFRRYLTVKLPDERQAYFRFYDPRALETFLTSGNGDEAAAFCGPVTEFLLFSEGRGEWLRIRPSAQAGGSPPRIFPVRAEQMAAFRQQMAGGFVRRMRDRFRALFPEQLAVWDDKMLDQFLQRWIADARQHELTYEKDVERYLELCLRYPELVNVPRPAWVNELLDYPHRRGVDKLDQLENQLTQGRQPA